MQQLNEFCSAAILHNVGELAACLFDYDLYRDYKKSIGSGSTNLTAAKATFGFNFNDLGKLLAEQWRLPDLVEESLQKSTNISRSARLIQLAANISQQAETGWNHNAMKTAIEVTASFVNQPVTSLQNDIKTSAIESARKFTIADVFPAAARLILQPDIAPLPDNEIAEPMSPVSSTQLTLQERIKSLVKSATASQSPIIKLLADGLYEDLKFSRVVMVFFQRTGLR